MSAISCPQEAIITKAARTGCWDVSSQEHVKGCSHCREIVQIVEWLHDIAGAEEIEHPAPDGEQIWLNARIIELQETRERALRPLALVQFVIRAAMILALAGGITWVWSGFQSLTANPLSTSMRVPQPIIVSASALATCMIALLFVKLVQPMLIEE